jgi:hypothetical protein
MRRPLMRLMIGEVVLDYLRSMNWKTYPVHLHVRDATPNAAAVTPSTKEFAICQSF